MSLICFESFDHYGSIDDMLLREGRLKWSGGFSFSNFVDGTDTRFNYGQALYLSSIASLYGHVNVNLAGGVVGFAAKLDTGVSTDLSVQFQDTFSNPTNPRNVATVGFTGGSGQIYIADYQGHIVASTVNGIFASNSWFYLEIMVTVGSSTGGGKVSVRINNQPILGMIDVPGNFHDPGSPPSTPPAAMSFNRFIIAGGYATIDDLHVNSTTDSDPGAYANNSWVGDTRALTLYPSSDFSVQWTNPHMPYFDYATPYIPGGSWGPGGGSSHVINYVAMRAAHTGTLTSIHVFVMTDTIARINAALYTDSGGNPDNLLVQGTEVVNPVAGDLYIPISGMTIVKGTVYWTAITSDVGVTLGGFGDVSYVRAAEQFGFTYTGSFPASAAASGAYNGIGSPGIGMISTMNAQNVNEIVFDGDMTYNTSITPGQEDLFNCDSTIPSTLNIIGIQVIGAYKKDDANPHTMTQHLRSGATDAAGTVFTLNSSWFYTSDIYILDPDTGSNWTVSGANNIKIGYKLET